MSSTTTPADRDSVDNKNNDDDNDDDATATATTTTTTTNRASSRSCRFVVTGFGPFRGVPDNPTSILIRRLRGGEERRGEEKEVAPLRRQRQRASNPKTITSARPIYWKRRPSTCARGSMTFTND
mmetsp:Transcript_23122/g.55762  ORF Transcript_23122/g.55762 Transcript_23122/m.55762 type:complete len:125 (+) Transcript_23122:178-552(+)